MGKQRTKKRKVGRPTLQVPTSGEARVLRAIWQLDALTRRSPTIAEIRRELGGTQHYNTVSTLVLIMERKGYVKRANGSVRAVWTLERCLRAALLQVVDDYQTVLPILADVIAGLDA